MFAGASRLTPPQAAASPRKGRRWVLHADADCFFASCEMAAKPSLAGTAVVVAGAGGRGVVTAASYPARAFGVRSGMPGAEARALAPDATFLPVRFAAYEKASRAMMEVFAQFGTLEVASIDEAYIDVRIDAPAEEQDARIAQVCHDVRAAVSDTVGIPVTVGAAPGKLVAKIASASAKPAGVRVVPESQVQQFLAGIELRDVPGIGPATLRRLNRASVFSITELREVDPARLSRLVGAANARFLTMVATGVDPRPVAPGGPAKSVSVARTLPREVMAGPDLDAVVIALTSEAVSRLSDAGFVAAGSVTVHLRTTDFIDRGKSRTLSAPVEDTKILSATAIALANKLADELHGQNAERPGPARIRLVSVGLGALATSVQQTLDLDLPETVTEVEAAQVHAAWQSSDPDPWPVGRHVEHRFYGYGWITRVDGDGSLLIRFERFGGPPGRTRRVLPRPGVLRLLPV